MENEKKGLDEEALKGKIQEILDSINSCENPEELEELKRIIRKNVPFTRRGYFSALLLKMVISRPQRRERRNDRDFQREHKNMEKRPVQSENGESTEEKSERVFPEGAKTLYLNIGKMKHLYAKNLSIYLQKELGIKREDIYSLRVHDKYSFITMSEENCNRAIETLNGKDINGRTAYFSFSTK